ncbi:MAG TPA: alpha/beta fold hydrolase [Solirubrobacteraceae bacterium]|nr:alpha/beta fold hydrolase [Solirubrobacteraceae bacterium]
MSSSSPHAARLAAAEAGFRSLPDSYLGAAPGFDAPWRIVLGDVGHTWEVRCTTHGARVRNGATSRTPDVVIGTDAETWMALRCGGLSGIEAFSRRLLYARGNLDLAIAFEGLFRLEDGRRPLLRVHDVHLPGRRVSTLTMGAGPDVLLLHGLGGAKSSFFDTAAALSQRYRVHALDLPGFGASSKPTTAPYTARWFAETVLATMDELGIGRAHVVGNSMGGRIAIELGLRNPERVVSLGLLCPAVAFVKRTYHPVVRLMRPELGLLPHRFAREKVAEQFWNLFADSDGIDPAMADVVVDEFQRIYASAGGRIAFLSAARSIYLEAPYGADGFYGRLSQLEPPALFVWGSHDRVIPPAFGRHVARWLPSAEQIVLDRCGHVPQVECAEQTSELLEELFARADAPAALPRSGTQEAA